MLVLGVKMVSVTEPFFHNSTRTPANSASVLGEFFMYMYTQHAANNPITSRYPKGFFEVLNFARSEATVAFSSRFSCSKASKRSLVLGDKNSMSLGIKAVQLIFQ